VGTTFSPYSRQTVMQQNNIVALHTQYFFKIGLRS